MPNETEIIPPDPLADGDREERIRQRAYQLWEEDGAPKKERRSTGIVPGGLSNKKSEPKARIRRSALAPRLSILSFSINGRAKTEHFLRRPHR